MSLIVSVLGHISQSSVFDKSSSNKSKVIDEEEMAAISVEEIQTRNEMNLHDSNDEYNYDLNAQEQNKQVS